MNDASNSHRDATSLLWACRWKEPLRHTLMRIRAQKPILFANRPIPFREEDIRNDETFMAILAQEVYEKPSAATQQELCARSYDQ